MFSADQVAQWVLASCQSQGVPVKVSDAAVLKRVGVLLGSGSPATGRVETGRAHAAAAASTPRTARRVGGSRSLQLPDGLHSGRVQAAGSHGARSDHGVIDNSADDAGLPVEVQGVPRSA